MTQFCWPKVTIAIPTRNRPSKLIYAVKSILSQPYENIEILIVDNHSTDDSYQLFKDFNDQRLKYVGYKWTGSINEQFKRCYLNASGDYLLIIGDDDCILPCFTQVLEHILKYSDNQIDAIGWHVGSYRWPDFAENERNVASMQWPSSSINKGDLELFDFTKLLPSILNSNVKFLYRAPGIYHKIISMKFLRKLCYKYGEDNVFVHSADLSVAAHCLLNPINCLWSAYPISLAGYSQSSTGSAMAMNDNKKYVDMYLDENPDFKQQAEKYLFCDKTIKLSAISEVLITTISFNHVATLYSKPVIPVQTYINSECLNVNKLAKSMRPLMLKQLKTVSEIHQLNQKSDQLMHFLSNMQSETKALATRNICQKSDKEFVSTLSNKIYNGNSYSIRVLMNDSTNILQAISKLEAIFDKNCY